ncbi:MAG: alpha/beta hydrolase [Candidatus Izemoplasmatales bacterium]
MARIIHHKQKLSDKFGVGLVKFAFRFKAARERYNFKFKFIFTNQLSKDYSFGKKIEKSVLNVNGIKTEVIKYKNETPKFALIQLHGGAYVSGLNDSYRRVAKRYLKINPNLEIYSLCYSLAPEHPFPKALEESIDLYKHLLKNKYDNNHIFIVGDSAGGGLALATVLALKDKMIPLPRSIITMSAWTDLAGEGESHTKNVDCDPFFGKGTIPLDKEAYAQDNDLHHPYISPKYGDFEGFPDTLMFVGGNELIESDTLDVGNKITNAIVHDFEGMFHVFPFGLNKMASSRKSWEIIDEFINKQIRS